MEVQTTEEIATVDVSAPGPMEKPRRIAAVLFDVDGTLYYQPLLRFFMLCELLLCPLRVQSIRRAALIVRIIRAFRKVREELRWAPSPHASLRERQFEITAARVGASQEDVKAVIQEWIFTRPLKYLRFCRRRGLAAAIDALEEAGVKLGAFSDYPVLDKLKAMGLERYFSVRLCATDHEVNVFKPDPKGFLRACDVWGLKPAEVVYVGDRPEIDAAGARAAGMPCALLVARMLAPALKQSLSPERPVTINNFRRLVHAIANVV